MQRENSENNEGGNGRERRLANLRPFKPGQSGNPNGRPRSALLSDALRRELVEQMPDAPEKTIAEGVAAKLIERALSGDVQAIKEVFDRAEGKVSQNIVADVGLTDWRVIANVHNLDEKEILNEAVRLLGGGNCDSESSGE